jgi:hypothetical protein
LVQLEDRSVPAVVAQPAIAALPAVTNLEAAAAVIRPIPSQPVLFGNSLTLAANSLSGPQLVDPSVTLALPSAVVPGLTLPTPIVQTFATSTPSAFPVLTPQAAIATELQPPVPTFNNSGLPASTSELANRYAPLSFSYDSGYAEPDTGAAQSAASHGTVTAGTDPAASYWGIWTDDTGVGHETRREPDAPESKADSPVAKLWSVAQRAGSDVATSVVDRLAGWIHEWQEFQMPRREVPLRPAMIPTLGPDVGGAAGDSGHSE